MRVWRETRHGTAWFRRERAGGWAGTALAQPLRVPVTRVSLGRWATLALAASLAPPAAGAADPADPGTGAGAAERVVWSLPEPSALSDALSSVAVEAVTGRVAVGGRRGAWLRGRDGGFARVLHRGPVRDLAFLEDGSLLAATGSGLYRVDPERRVATVAPAAGAQARDVRRIAVRPGLALLASAAGAYLSRDGHRWRRLSPTLPTGPATTVALRERPGGWECFSVIGGALWRTRLRTRGPEIDSGDSSRVRIPFADGSGAPVDVSFDAPGTDLVVVYPRVLAVRRVPDADFDVLRPALPPGCRTARLVHALGRFWLATDCGLLFAERLEGPWQRALLPGGTSTVSELIARDSSLLAATDRGLVSGRLASHRSAPSPGVSSAFTPPAGQAEFPPDPPIEQVFRAALAYLQLQPARVAALRRGLARRGWLPEAVFRITHENDSGYRTDWDQSFVSGALRRLVDRDRDRSNELFLSLTLSWDLGDIAYHPEAIDVSREAREIIELRDDVLDEITQLYFERRRVLDALARAPASEDIEAVRLRLRAQELAAGIDAWTGGWFGRRR
jgi:hypothetical protein